MVLKKQIDLTFIAFPFFACCFRSERCFQSMLMLKKPEIPKYYIKMRMLILFTKASKCFLTCQCKSHATTPFSAKIS